MQAPVRMALVGLGDIGLSQHLPALLRAREQGRVELAALVDPDPARVRLAGDLAGPLATYATYAGYADVDPVLADDTIPAVVLATPPWVTTGLAARCAEAGRFVLAEKPIATSASAAHPLLELDEAVRARIQVGLTYRHDPVLERLRERIAHGPLDGPLLIRAHIYDEADDRNADDRNADDAETEHGVRMRRTLEHGPPIIHEGAHVFDWLAYLLDAGPERVADAWSLRTDATFATPNLIGGRLHYPGGSQALVEFGWMTASLPRCEVSLLGRHAHAVLDGFTFHLELATASGTEVIEDPTDRMTRCFDRQLDRFRALAEGRNRRAVPGVEEGLAALRTAEEIAVRAQGDESS